MIFQRRVEYGDDGSANAWIWGSSNDDGDGGRTTGSFGFIVFPEEQYIRIRIPKIACRE